MARRWRDYRVSITSRKDGWDVVYTRRVHANSKFMAAFRARTFFPVEDEEQAGNASDITVEVP